MWNVLIRLYISIIMVFEIHFNYNLYIIHIIQSSDCEVFLFNKRFNWNLTLTGILSNIQFALKFLPMTFYMAPQLPRFEPGLTTILGPLQNKQKKSTSHRHWQFSMSRVWYYSNSTASFAFNLILLAGDMEVNPGMSVNGNGARKPQKDIKIAHLNARSIKNRDHYTLTETLVAENDFDIFTISETCLNNSITD